MNDHERIEKLLEEGKITEEEARLLREALGTPLSEPATPDAPSTLRWVRVRLTAGELVASFDPNLREPEVEGKVETRENGRDLEVAPQTTVGGLKVGRVNVRVPAGWGLEVHGTAGEVRARGLPYVKARLMAGEVDLSDVQGVDVEVKTGQIEGSVVLTQGRHRLHVTLGEVDVKILPGSSVKVESRVGLGNLETTPRQVGQGQAQLEASVSVGNLEVRA
ncbi:hypothetical protein [Calidithermus timidus]|jgi:hypothetical protein|uniref:hypothetical protein n=1 Tax=Calidithermus timidus TaxID=307124 RepID=UPI00035E30E6|nr:hypothetical protein [Calidithermus timidus]